MKTVLKNILQRVLELSLELCANRPLPYIIKVVRKLNGIQLSHEELRIIISTVQEKRPCNFLVFGLGRDSLLWSRINQGGNTVFVEDNQSWFHKVLKWDHRLKAYLVDYLTQRSQWQDLLESPDLLDMALPEEIEKEKWDVILVDAPAGDDDSQPGRMKSIFLASRLAHNSRHSGHSSDSSHSSHSSDVFVHDCDREVEKVYCDRFLKPENLKAEVRKLRHYHIANRCASPS